MPFPPSREFFLDPGIQTTSPWQVDLNSLEKVKAIPSHTWNETRRGEEREPKKNNNVLLFSSFLKKQVKTLNTPWHQLLKLNAPFSNLKAWLNFKETGGGGGTLYERVMSFPETRSLGLNYREHSSTRQ